MKKLFFALAVMLSFSSFGSGYPAESELKKLIGMGLHQKVKGTTQGFTSCSLDQKVSMKLYKDVIRNDGSLIFRVASTRHWRKHEPVNPIVGRVAYEVTNDEGQLIEFSDFDGEVFTLGAFDNRFYVVESDKSFETRLRLGADCAGYETEGKLVLIFDDFKLIDLSAVIYEMVETNEGMILKEKGIMDFKNDLGLGKMPRHYHHHHNSAQNRRYFGR